MPMQFFLLSVTPYHFPHCQELKSVYTFLGMTGRTINHFIGGQEEDNPQADEEIMAKISSLVLIACLCKNSCHEKFQS